jgi:outer membrane protein TolC
VTPSARRGRPRPPVVVARGAGRGVVRAALLGVVAAAAVLAAPAPAEPAAQATVPPRLTLKAVWAAVDLHHPQLAMALLDNQAALGEQRAAEGAFDPRLRAEARGGSGNYTHGQAAVGIDAPTTLWGLRVQGGWRQGVGDFPIYDGKAKTNDWGQVHLGVVLPLLRDGFTDLARTALALRDADVDAQQEAMRQVQLELRRASALVYLDWVAAVERQSVAQSLLDIAVERDRQVTRRVADGDLPEVERIDNARLVAQRQARLVGAVRAAEQAAVGLAFFLRDDAGTPLLAPSTRAPPLSAALGELELRLGATPALGAAAPLVLDDALLAEAMQARPDAGRLRARLRGQEQVRVYAENQVLPELSIMAGVSQHIGPTHGALQSSDTVWNPDPKTRELPDVGLGVRFELPTLMRTPLGRLDAASARERQAEAALRLVEDRVRVELLDALSAARAARLRQGYVRTERDAAAQVEEAERRRVALGDGTILLVNLREQATAEAALGVVDADVDTGRAAVQFATAAGRILGDVD